MGRRTIKFAKTGAFSKDFGLRDQIQRSAVSVMANIAEGFERGGDKEFGQFLSLAKGSCGEVRSHLHVAGDQGYITQEVHDDLAARALEVSRMISGLMTYLRNSGFRGTKFK